MRPLVLIAAAAFSLTACGNNDQSDNTANVDENLTAENIVSNDVTAIDAVTGEDANMAADVNYSNEFDNALDNGSNAAAPGNPAKPSAKPSAKPRATSESPATNAASNSTD
jgi:hypothetical protein